MPEQDFVTECYGRFRVQEALSQDDLTPDELPRKSRELCLFAPREIGSYNDALMARLCVQPALVEALPPIGASKQTHAN